MKRHEHLTKKEWACSPETMQTEGPSTMQRSANKKDTAAKRQRTNQCLCLTGSDDKLTRLPRWRRVRAGRYCPKSAMQLGKKRIGERPTEQPVVKGEETVNQRQSCAKSATTSERPQHKPKACDWANERLGNYASAECKRFRKHPAKEE